MTEIPSPQEQVMQPLDQLAADQVFNGVYDTFAEVAKAKRQRNEFSNGQVIAIELDPAAEFVGQRFTAAQEKVSHFDKQQGQATQVQDKFIGEATSTASQDYGNNSLAIAARLERANRLVGNFVDRATRMVVAGETDSLTVKTFFGSIDSLKHGLSQGYNDLVRKTDEPVPGPQAQDIYNQTVQSVFGSKPNVEEQHNGGFVHINGERYLQSGEQTTERYYISPKLNAQPGEVVRLWADTLAERGVSEKLYYKVATHLSRRYDTVIAYASPETADETREAIQAFLGKCPPELLSDTDLPSGVPVGKGVSRAPEPAALNTLLRYRGKDTVSYNELATGLTELSLRRASYDFIKQGVPPTQVTPKMLAESGKVYFGQFIKLAGLDPTTMQVAA